MTSVVNGDSAEKLRRLQAVTDAALSQLGLEDLLNELLERTLDLLGAETAAVLLLDATGTELVTTASIGLAAEAEQGFRVPVGRGLAGAVAARRQPVSVLHVTPDDMISPATRSEHVASVLGVPMLSDGDMIGVLHVGTSKPRAFTADDVELLQLVADRASMATQARLSRLDRAAALALQRSLLPARPRRIPGLDIDARYVPGAEVGVGGDWYDVFELPSRHIGIAIGDVAGSGLHAAVVMGRIRSALRAYALETDDPGEVLTRLDRKVQLFEPGAMATVLYAVLEPTHDILRLSSAGHLQPVLAETDTPARLIAVKPDLPLGAYPDTARHVTQVPLHVGSYLMMYTDGLVERRARPLSAGINLLLAAVTCNSADAMCAAALASLLHETHASDDIAILAVGRGSRPT